MEDKELSQWFDINEQKPWEPGVYEIQYQYGPIGCAYFNGNEFAYGWVIGSREENIKYALRSANRVDCSQPISWRGISSDPSAKPKQKPKGNRKVTRYVVMLDKNPIAVFDTRKECLDYVKRGNIWWSSIEKIRFRTKEA